MPIPQHQILMGVGIAAMCFAGLTRHRWLLANTRKGQSLVSRYGESVARFIACLLCLLGITFGSLLAIGLVHPISWR